MVKAVNAMAEKFYPEKITAEEERKRKARLRRRVPFAGKGYTWSRRNAFDRGLRGLDTSTLAGRKFAGAITTGGIGEVYSSGPMIRVRRQAEREALLMQERAARGIALTPEEAREEQQAEQLRREQADVEEQKRREAVQIEQRKEEQILDVEQAQQSREFQSQQAEAGRQAAVELQNMRDVGDLLGASVQQVTNALGWQQKALTEGWKFSAQDQQTYNDLLGMERSLLEDENIESPDKQAALRQLRAKRAALMPQQPERPNPQEGIQTWKAPNGTQWPVVRDANAEWKVLPGYNSQEDEHAQRVSKREEVYFKVLLASEKDDNTRTEPLSDEEIAQIRTRAQQMAEKDFEEKPKPPAATSAGTSGAASTSPADTSKSAADIDTALRATGM